MSKGDYLKMKLPSKKESEVIKSVIVAAEAKHRQLLSQNKEAARALLSSIASSQVSTVTRVITSITANE